MAKPKKGKKHLKGQDAKKMLPLFKKFNSIAGIFIKTLNQKIDEEEKQLNTISIMVKTRTKLPQTGSQVNVQTIDIKKTKIKKDGYTFNKEMDWEKDIRKDNNRGIVL